MSFESIIRDAKIPMSFVNEIFNGPFFKNGDIFGMDEVLDVVESMVIWYEPKDVVYLQDPNLYQTLHVMRCICEKTVPRGHTTLVLSLSWEKDKTHNHLAIASVDWSPIFYTWYAEKWAWFIHMSVQFFKMKSVCFVIPTYKLHMPAKNIDEQIQVELDRIYKGRAIYVHHDGAYEHDFALMFDRMELPSIENRSKRHAYVYNALVGNRDKNTKLKEENSFLFTTDLTVEQDIFYNTDREVVDADGNHFFSIPDYLLHRFQHTAVNKATFKVGSEVNIHGLVKAQRLNGLKGTIVQKFKDGRWPVLVGEKYVRIKEKNLELVIKTTKETPEFLMKKYWKLLCMNKFQQSHNQKKEDIDQLWANAEKKRPRRMRNFCKKYDEEIPEEYKTECAVCGLKDGEKRGGKVVYNQKCAQCGQTWYCCRAHQKLHWKREHRRVCKPRDTQV